VEALQWPHLILVDYFSARLEEVDESCRHLVHSLYLVASIVGKWYMMRLSIVTFLHIIGDSGSWRRCTL
jgi:hypothetical protein